MSDESKMMNEDEFYQQKDELASLMAQLQAGFAARTDIATAVRLSAVAIGAFVRSNLIKPEYQEAWNDVNDRYMKYKVEHLLGVALSPKEIEALRAALDEAERSLK